MAVIIADMDMPKNCMDCIFGYFYREGGANGIKCCLTKENSFGESKEKDSNYRFCCCPMKSVDGLIQTLRDQFADEDGNAVGEYWKHEDVIEIIKEYCGMED